MLGVVESLLLPPLPSPTKSSSRAQFSLAFHSIRADKQIWRTSLISKQLYGALMVRVYNTNLVNMLLMLL